MYFADLLRTFTIGICGSDVHFWKHGRIGSSLICASQGLGHESAGEIVKIGENVHGFKVGMLFFSCLLHCAPRFVVTRSIRFSDLNEQQEIELLWNAAFHAPSLRVRLAELVNIMLVQQRSSTRLHRYTAHFAGIMSIQRLGCIDCPTR